MIDLFPGSLRLYAFPEAHAQMSTRIRAHTRAREPIGSAWRHRSRNPERSRINLMLYAGILLGHHCVKQRHEHYSPNSQNSQNIQNIQNMNYVNLIYNEIKFVFFFIFRKIWKTRKYFGALLVCFV